MAFPVPESTAESKTITAATSHVVDLPAGIQAGEVIVILGAKVGATTVNALSGWLEVIDEDINRGAVVLVRLADGTEGATVTIETAASQKPVFIAYRISGALDPNTELPTISTVATGTSTAPEASTCNPGVAEDILWLTFFTLATEEADDDTWCNSAPANYSNLLQVTAGTAGNNNSAILASAERQLNASSEDAGAFDIDLSLAWRAFTLAIRPAGSAAQELAATLASTSTLSGDVDVEKPLSAALASSSGLAADLLDETPLVASLDSTSDLDGALLAEKPLGATLASSSELDGDLRDGKPLAASLDSQSQIATDLLIEKPLAATLASQSALDGSLVAGGGGGGIQFDADLGSAAAPSYALTTSAPAAPGTRIIFEIHYYDETKTLTGATDDDAGLTWVVDVQQKHPDNGHRIGLLSAYAPSGLASGATITPTFSGGGSPAFPDGCAASSWTGLKSGASGYAEDTDSSGQYQSTWSTSLSSVGDALLFSASYVAFFSAGGTHAPATDYTEVRGEFGSAATDRLVAVSRIVSADGTYTPGGTWSDGGGIALELEAGVAYDAAAEGGAPIDLAATLASISTFVGDLLDETPLAGTLASGSAVVGALRDAKPVAATLSSLSSVAAALQDSKTLQSTLASISSLTGSTHVQKPLAAVLASGGDALGRLQVGIPAVIKKFRALLGVGR